MTYKVNKFFHLMVVLIKVNIGMINLYPTYKINKRLNSIVLGSGSLNKSSFETIIGEWLCQK